MNERYNNIFGQVFPIKSAEIFSDMVSDLSKLNFTVADADVKGDAFEYFLKNAYQGIKIKDLGEYFTPRNIVRTMVSMVDPKIGESIYDLFCGTGGFLIEAFRYVSLRAAVTPEIHKMLTKKTIYGSEIAMSARVARMNMVLYGDGHSNVYQQDSFAYPLNEEYDIVLTNPPYSQKTRHGHLYPIPAKNGDVIAIQHCLKSLKPGGRAAILMKEDFLTKSGVVGRVRDYFLNSVKNVSVVSLPRGLFLPYTPTKTSILYFEKEGTRSTVFFFVVKHVGHTFGAKQRATAENDLPNVLSASNDPSSASELSIDYHIEEKDTIDQNNNSLWIYDYIESLPPERESENTLEVLGDHVESSGFRITPSETPYEDFRVLGISNSEGIFMNEVKSGNEFKENYKAIKVQASDFVYNPHRVDVGSIGIVPESLAGGIVSGAYVVFRLKPTSQIPPYYLLYLLKSEDYLNIIRAYDTRHDAVRGKLTFSQLIRIKLYVPDPVVISSFNTLQTQIQNCRNEADELESTLVEDYFKRTSR